MHFLRGSRFCRRTPALAAVFLVSLIGCSQKPAGKRYPLEGRVVAVDAGNDLLTVAHHDIPGLMKGMTMPFTVSKADTWVFKAIAPGDQIHATLVLSDHAELQDISFTKGNENDSDDLSKVRTPQPGDAVPDFRFVNQDGKTIHLSQFRGKPLLLTFIYTRCPFPDYCIRMSSNFAHVLDDLHKNPNAYQDARLLSISIDPENDKPAILKKYGETYVGRTDPGFIHWQFASGTPAEVRKTAGFFGLTYNQKDGQIVHGLQTILIGKDGKVLKVYSGNDWKPDQVAADFAAAAGS